MCKYCENGYPIIFVGVEATRALLEENNNDCNRFADALWELRNTSRRKFHEHECFANYLYIDEDFGAEMHILAVNDGITDDFYSHDIICCPMCGREL